MSTAMAKSAQGIEQGAGVVRRKTRSEACMLLALARPRQGWQAPRQQEERACSFGHVI